MEALIVVVVIIAILAPIVIIILSLNTNSRIDEMEKILSRELKSLRDEISPVQESEAEDERYRFFTEADDPNQSDVSDSKISVDITIPLEEQNQSIESIQGFEVSKNPESYKESSKVDSEPHRKKRNWEKLIGENILNKIGISVLVIGIGYLIRHAFSTADLREIGNIALGACSGFLLLFFGQRLQDKMRSFSSVLFGGAISVFYFTSAIAFRDYELIGQMGAFTIMILITGLSVVLSLINNRQELAVISILGGFATPLMVSTGAGNYIFLFSYLAILNFGILSIGYIKKWPVLQYLSLGLTSVFYASWVVQNVLPEGENAEGMFFFGSLFFLTFFANNILYNLRNRLAFSPREFMLQFLFTGMYFALGMLLLDTISDGMFKGLFCGILAALHLGFAYLFYKKKTVDKNLVYLMISLCLTFTSLIAPVELEGNNITLFWLSEMVLMLWLGKMVNIKLIIRSAHVIGMLGLISLVWDWVDVYFGMRYANEVYLPLLNRGIITTLVAILGYSAFRKIADYNSISSVFPAVSNALISKLVNYLILSVTYIGVSLEIHDHILNRISYEPLQGLLILFFHLIFISTIWVFNKGEKLALKNIFGVLTLSAIIAVVTVMNDLALDARWDIIEGVNGAVLAYGVHFLILVVTSFMVRKSWNNFKHKIRSDIYLHGLLNWTFAVVTLLIVSREFDHFMVISNQDLGGNVVEYLRSWKRTAYPVIWSLCASLWLIMGMKKGIRHWRIIGLGIFTVVLAKLFIFDISTISDTGRIIAYISLGVFLLVVSFMYQKLKSLIFSEDE